MKYYAGIGSRSTPKNILELITKIAQKLHDKDYVLRSGGADGADLAFEKGAGNKKQIFLPWKGFNKSTSEHHKLNDELIDFSLGYHPHADSLSDAVKKLMARNAQQVLGPILIQPSKFVICWTPADKEGGTGHALRIARDHDISIYNLREEEVWERMERFVLG